MLPQSKNFTRKWLTLLFVISFLLNIQASYACAMMPDMAKTQNECCCGSNHRMDEVTDSISAIKHTTDTHTVPPVTSSDCNDPQMRCCIVEMSVGINDPPGDESISVGSSTKSYAQKLVKHLDIVTPATTCCAWTSNIELRQSEIRVIPPDPLLQHPSTPQYKATQRYRI